MGLNTEAEERQQMRERVEIPWKSRVQYLGILLNPSLLQESNWTPLIKSVQHQWAIWNGFKFFGLGRIAVINMKTVLKFVSGCLILNSYLQYYGLPSY